MSTSHYGVRNNNCNAMLTAAKLRCVDRVDLSAVNLCKYLVSAF